jgi:hypothetical protein
MAAEPTQNPAQPKRRWHQFSLRTLLTVVTLAGIACACSAPAVRAWQEARRRDAEGQTLAELLCPHDRGLMTVWGTIGAWRFNSYGASCAGSTFFPTIHQPPRQDSGAADH